MTVRMTNQTAATMTLPAPYSTSVAASAYTDVADTRENIQTAFVAAGHAMTGWSLYELPTEPVRAATPWDLAVRVRAQAAVTLTAPGANIDGIAMAAGDRFLTNIQGGVLPGTTNAANGIYVWNGAAATATRAADFSLGTPCGQTVVKVTEGTDAEILFTCSTDGVVGDAIAFTQIGFAGTITDETHGARGRKIAAGTAHHTGATTAEPGFQSAADKAKEDKYPATATAGAKIYGDGTSYVELAPPATPAIAKHTGSGGTNIPAYITLAGAGADADKLLQVNAAGADFELDLLSNNGHGGLSYQTGGSTQHHSSATSTTPGFMTAAQVKDLDAFLATILGDGSDGAADFTAAGAVIPGATHLGAGVYRLDRITNYTTITVRAGAVVVGNGFPLRGNSDVAIEATGIVHWGGVAGTGGGGGGGAGAGSPAGALPGGYGGGAGSAAGVGGVAGTASAVTDSAAGGNGGAGGAAGGAAGPGGAVTAPTANMGTIISALNAITAKLPGFNAGVQTWLLGGPGGGGGGGGGAGGGAGGQGGGGGGGGGYGLIVSGGTLDNQGTIHANGAPGGVGADGAGGAAGGGGGGGGGSGGKLFAIARVFSVTGNLPTATGGAPGTGGANVGGGNADPGVVGGAGSVVRITI
jgi:hypothetical protein